MADVGNADATLYHFSEDPGIRWFEPRIAPTSLVQDRPFVWAIDEWHAPMYFVPRDCPRACFWAAEHTSEADRERWMGHVSAHFVMMIESRWFARVREGRLYRYSMPAATFEKHDATAGHWVSHVGVAPSATAPLNDLLGGIVAANVELRVAPELGPIWRRVRRSTLAFSGTRLRYAHGYPDAFD